jgi:hypothetical protein
MSAIITILGPGRAFLSLALLILAACGTGPKAAITTAEPSTTAAALSPTPLPAAIATSPAPSASLTPPTAFPAATSRGPELEASDPKTVKLDAGSLQLVEFFRFT